MPFTQKFFCFIIRKSFITKYERAKKFLGSCFYFFLENSICTAQSARTFYSGPHGERNKNQRQNKETSRKNQIAFCLGMRRSGFPVFHVFVPALFPGHPLVSEYAMDKPEWIRRRGECMHIAQNSNDPKHQENHSFGKKQVGKKNQYRRLSGNSLP